MGTGAELRKGMPLPILASLLFASGGVLLGVMALISLPASEPLIFGCAILLNFACIVYLVHTLGIRNSEFDATRTPGAVDRPVVGSAAVGYFASLLDRLRLEVTGDALLVLRLRSGARVFGAVYLGLSFLAGLMKLTGVPRDSLFGGRMFLVLPVFLVVMARLQIPAPLRRFAVPWTSVRTAVETQKGIEFHFTGREDMASLVVALDDHDRKRLVALLQGRCPVVPLAPASRPVHDAAPAIDGKTQKDLDAARDRLSRM